MITITLIVVLLIILSNHQINCFNINNNNNSNGISKVLKRLIAVTTTTSILFTTNILPSYGSSNDAFVSALASIIEAKDVIKPVKNFIELQAYDNARTNIKYVINQMQLQKKTDALIQNSLDVTEDSDAIDLAADANSRILNTANQLDSTIYTCVFIPSEDGTISTTQEKYRQQSYTFYNSLLKDFDDVIKVAPDAQLKEAQAIADVDIKKLPKVLFKSIGLKQTGI
jgi:hypothetical protein